MANANGWGDGSVNNNIGWGQGAVNNNISWGKSQITSWSGATDIDGGNAPVNTVAPAITGTAQEGQTLTCSTGTWSGSPTYTYQWKRNGSNIGSATNSTYLLVTADVGQSILCTVTATNALGSSNANSNTVTPTSAFVGLLDTYSGASAAYSLRRLSSTYTGNAIRVRRSSDNAELNIGFVSNVLDTASLLTFCGVGNGFVTTWYDQSGSGNNVTQSTAANQPQIVSSGAMLTTNGKNSIKFDGSNDFLATTGTPFSATQNTMIAVSKQDSASTFRRLFNIGRYTSGRYLGSAATNDDMLASFGDGALNCSGGTSLAQNVSIMHNNATTGFLRNNGSQVNSTSITIFTFTKDLFIGNSDENLGGFYWNGIGQEFIFYPSNQATNVIGIESNINTYYTIY